MNEKNDLKENSMDANFLTNDSHRRRILFTSMEGKLNSANLMLDAAIEAAAEAKSSYRLGDKASSLRHSEAVYAAIEEIIQSLSMVQGLSVKSGNSRPIPPMGKFRNAVEEMDKEESPFLNSK